MKLRRIKSEWWNRYCWGACCQYRPIRVYAEEAESNSVPSKWLLTVNECLPKNSTPHENTIDTHSFQFVIADLIKCFKIFISSGIFSLRPMLISTSKYCLIFSFSFSFAVVALLFTLFLTHFHRHIESIYWKSALCVLFHLDVLLPLSCKSKRLFFRCS